MDIGFLKSNLIAHRGLHDKYIPENSMLAFIKAINNNYLIEFDVHILKDGNVVVFHDNNLKRMTSIDKNIRDTTYEEIKSLKLLNTNEHIPLFSEVLKLVDGRVPLLIELKNDTKVGLLEKRIIDLLKDYRGLYAFQSFNPKSLIYLKKRCPNIPIGILILDYNRSNINVIKKIILKRKMINFIIKSDFISVNYKYLSDRCVQKYKNKKLILTWTIRNVNNLNKYKSLCDNFIFEKMD